MTASRQLMVDALREHTIPLIRAAGFRGTFPHFRRPEPIGIDLVTFQFDRNGGGFLIETSRCGVEGVTLHWGKHVPPEKVSAWDMHPSMRVRLRSTTERQGDPWFRFDNGDYERAARLAATSVVEYLRKGSSVA